MSNTKLKIGVSLRIVKSLTYPEKRDALSHDWASLLENLNFIPILIPNALKKLEKFLETVEVDGFILSGGDNIGDDSERDETEKKIIEYGKRKKIPILGVCRGMQVINNYFEGSIQKTDDHSHVGTSHDLQIENSNLISSFKNSIISVNSFHQNIITEKELGINLKSFAVCEKDKTIEGFFHEKFPFLGIMWHPERKADKNSLILLQKVFQDNEFWKKLHCIQ